MPYKYKKFLDLTKPGIIFGNLITVLGGFFLASKTHIDFFILFKTIIGISEIIATGCVINNCYDQDIDKLMERTKNRPMALGLISNRDALIFAFILFMVGSTCLFYVNLISLYTAIIGLFFYVVVYTMLFKRNTIHGTLIGSISGSTPPVIGYIAVSGRFDLGALLLFLILTTWQMPHSYAIGIFRLEDYKKAGINLFPVKKGIALTKKHMLVWIILFTIFNTLLSLCGYTGYLYLITALLFSIAWIYLSLTGFNRNTDSNSWARKMFFFSILCITALSVMMSINVA
jgi:heme o synthase